MTLVINIGWALTLVLVVVRVAAALALTPLLALGSMPRQVRVLWVLALSVGFLSVLAAPPNPAPVGVGGLALAVLTEMLIGALLAFGLMTAFATFQLAGRILDLQLGLSVANLVDPTTRTQAPLLGTFLHFAAVALFFAVDGHHMVVRGLAFSFEHIPPGTALTALDMGAVVAQFGAMFVYAVALAAPVMFVLLLVDMAMAVMGRSMPQMNVFIVSIPIKIIVGLFVLALSVRYMGAVSGSIFEHLFDYWHTVLS